jgi:uncharacterized membrane protein
MELPGPDNAASLPINVARARWDAIDVARGIAIVAMAIYHFSWDLSFYKLIATNIVAEPAWRWFARSIAGSFLILAGTGLVLAHTSGFRRRPFVRRLARVGGAALAITVATRIAFPDSYIFFCILHCIAVSSVLALPFLRLPALATGAAAAFCFAAPHLFTSPALDEPLLDWLGLGLLDPRTNDYVPVFPWFGLVLAGILLGKALLRRPESLGLAGWRAESPLSRGLALAGRKSLPIYLIHQPLLLAILYGVLQITGPNPAAEAAPFIRECQASCGRENSDSASCRALCTCVVDELRNARLWRKVMTDAVTEDDQTRVSGLVQQCLRTPAPRP